MQGYKEKKAFIVTQGPSEETCNEFWKMVYQYNCGTVVMLSDMIEHNKQVCSPYWPKAGSEDYGDYNVEFMNEMHNNINESLTIREFQITCTTNEVYYYDNYTRNLFIEQHNNIIYSRIKQTECFGSRAFVGCTT